MTYNVCMISGEPRYDSLPVLMVDRYRNTPVNDRMAAEAQFCLNETEWIARLWAFETAPAPESRMEALFAGEDGRSAVRMYLTAGGAFGCEAAGRDVKEALSVYAFTGGDLQGEYWGGVLRLPRELFLDAVGIKTPEKGTILMGNVVKRIPSVGAAFWEAPCDADAPEAFGAFELIDY